MRPLGFGALYSRAAAKRGTDRSESGYGGLSPGRRNGPTVWPRELSGVVALSVAYKANSFTNDIPASRFGNRYLTGQIEKIFSASHVGSHKGTVMRPSPTGPWRFR